MAKKIPVNLVITGVDRVSKVLNRVTRKFPKLTKAVRKASLHFTILQKKTERFRNGLNKMGRSMRQTGGTMTRTMTAPIGLAGAAILRTGVNFQKSINKVAAITNTIIGGEVTPQFEALEKQALKLGSSTEFSSTQAADAMALLGRAGFKTNEILESTDDVLALASASGQDLAFTADVMAKTIRAFGLEATDAGRVSDVLADVARRTNVDLETLSETFKDAAPIAKSYGATLEQTAAITGLLGDVGIQGSKAGTTLKSIMLKIAAPSAKAAKMMKAMGVAVTKADGSMRSAGDILTEIGPKLGKLNKDKQLEVVNELFGLRGIAGASALMSKAIKDGKNPIANLTKTLEGSTGAAKEMQKTMLRGSVGALARFNSALEGVGLAFSKSGLLDAFTELLVMLTGFLTKLSSLSPFMLKFITIVAGIAAALGPLIIFFGFVSSGIAKIVTLFNLLAPIGAVIATIFGAISLPVLAVVGAVALLIGAFTRLFFAWDRIKKAFTGAKGFFSGIADATSVFFGGYSDAEEKAKLGAAKGAGNATQKIANGSEKGQAPNGGQLDVNFSNIPKGTKVQSSGPAIGNLNLGFSGGVQ